MSPSPSEPRPGLRELLRAVRKTGARDLLRARRSLIDAEQSQDLTADAPELVLFDERSHEILGRAQELAEDEREDAEAVAELVRMAGRDRHSLQLAALGARQWGAHHEHIDANRAHRLLQAALAGGPVQPADVEDERRFAILDPFDDEDRERQWDELIAREPRLADVEAEARTGAFGTEGDSLRLLSLEGDERKRAAAEALRRHQALTDRLTALIGPGSQQADILLSSRLAYNVAEDHLRRIGGEAPPV